MEERLSRIDTVRWTKDEQIRAQALETAVGWVGATSGRQASAQMLIVAAIFASFIRGEVPTESMPE